MANCIKLFNLDLHISVISDVKSHLERHFNENIKITEWCMSGHHFIMKKPKANPNWVNASNWQRIDKQAINNFVTEYKDFLSEFDGFVVTHSPIFALLYQGFNKPIYIVNSCRFDQPLCRTKNIEFRNYYIEQMQIMSKNGLLKIISNNKADQSYLLKETGIQSIHIPSLCNYTKVLYTGKKNQFIQWSGEIINNENIVHKHSLGFGYSWSLICEFKAIIHVPYEISTMSLFEHYTSCIPLIIPTKRLLKETAYSLQTFSAYGMKGDINEWIENADFYDKENMPFITYYDNQEHLQLILQEIDCKQIHLKMVEHNKKRQLLIENAMDESFKIFKSTI
uniref:Glycosyltransferase n=1 Tax=viral metagenome TaxID=1070528 RepID=A0A6C0LIS4_9ZZZZ